MVNWFKKIRDMLDKINEHKENESPKTDIHSKAESLYSLLYNDPNTTTNTIEIKHTDIEHVVQNRKIKKNTIITEYSCYFKGQQVGRYELIIHNNDPSIQEFEAFSTMNIQRNERSDFIQSLKIDYAMRESLKEEIAIYSKSKAALWDIKIKNLWASILRQICIHAKEKGVSSIRRETEAYSTGRFYTKILQSLEKDKIIQKYKVSGRSRIVWFSGIARFEVTI